MRVALSLVLLCSLRLGASASDACPITLIGGSGDPHRITITFKNNAQLPIRQLDFTCKAIDTEADKASRWHCYESDASFAPGVEQTVSYSLSGRIPGPVLVSVKSVTFSDGTTWKPSRHSSCPVLKIRLPLSN